MNTLLEMKKLDHNARDFQSIKVEDYIGAFEKALELNNQRLNEVETTTDISFDGVIKKIILSSKELDDVSLLFFNLKHAIGDERYHKLARDIMPLLSKAQSDFYLNEKIFKNISSLYKKGRTEEYTNERWQILEDYYQKFIQNGADLSDDDKATLREIDQNIAKVQPKFSENLLNATNSFELIVSDKAELDGLTENTKAGLKEAATKKGYEDKWLLSLSAPVYIAVMRDAESDALREKMYRAFTSRATTGEGSNVGVVKEIVSLLHKRAKLLGYETYAHYALTRRMAETPDRVWRFLKDLRDKYKPAAEKELNELRLFKKDLTGDDSIEPWQVSYYSEKLKKSKLDFDEELVKPYLKLENVLHGAFLTAEKLYGITFKERKDLPVYHEDVNVYEVFDDKESFLGLFYTDFFPRDTKQQGAWCTRFQAQGAEDTEVVRPHVSIVCNFTKPVGNTPSLLNIREVETLFHEFGHALHSLFSMCEFKTLACTNVYRDFVELPSQVLENWVREKDCLELFAKHYETGEVIPDHLIEKINDTSNFMEATASLRQLNFGFLDMSWYTTDPEDISNVFEFEKSATKSTTLISTPGESNFSCSFGHIFAGGYSAGYYSYKWAEVLDADAFEAFKEAGVFNREVANKFRNNILAKGGSEHPMKLYKDFRGKEPTVEPLLRRQGLMR